MLAMSRNYHIEQPDPRTAVETASDRLARISMLLSPPETLADKDLGRNVLTRTLDTALVLVRNYLPPLHWLFVAITAGVLFIYARIVAATARLVTAGSLHLVHNKKDAENQ